LKQFAAAAKHTNNYMPHYKVCLLLDAGVFLLLLCVLFFVEQHFLNVLEMLSHFNGSPKQSMGNS